MMRNVADRPFERMVACCQGLRGTCSLQGIWFGEKRPAWMEVAVDLLMGLSNPSGFNRSNLSRLSVE
jgi:hypothetical protein